MYINEERMSQRLIRLNQGGNEELVYLTRGIFDYFDEKNFPRLLEEYEFANKHNAKFYVGLYSDELMEKTGRVRELKGKISNQDRLNLVEALDFVDGAFIIDTLSKDKILDALEYKMLKQKNDTKKPTNLEKKYQVGYASGAFSNFHKGHLEHIIEMYKQCKTVIIAANSDRLIREYKNKNASVSENVRRQILSHIRYVNIATIVDEYDKLKAVESIKAALGQSFDAIFVGSDWRGDPKWDDFQKKFSQLGIDVVFTDRPENGISTTAIDKKNAKHKSKTPEYR